MSAFAKTVVRSIRGSLGRFLAIMGIVALGSGFFAGLQMCGPDMRAAADDLYSGTNLYDLRIVSTLGFEQRDIQRIKNIEGVQSVMPAISLDAMARMGQEQVAVRIGSLDVQAADESSEQNATTIISDDKDYLNRMFLREGRWPKRADECVICADRTEEGVKLGDRVEVLYGTVDLDEMLDERTLTVVGTVSSSKYPYTGSFGSTTLGSGMVVQYLFVLPSAFEDEKTFTEMYVSVEEAKDKQSASDDYNEAVDRVRERIEEQEAALARARLTDVKHTAQKELDDNRRKYEKERKDALGELDSADKKLRDANDELEDARVKLEKGQDEYDEGVRTLDASRADAMRQLDEGQRTIDDSVAELHSKMAELEDARQQLQEGEQEWEAGVAELLEQTGASSLDEARISLEAARQQADEGVAQLEGALAMAQDESTRAYLETQLVEARAGQAMAQEGLDGVAELESSGEQLEQSRAQLEQGEQQLDEGMAQLDDGQRELNERRADAERELAGGQQRLDDARDELDKGRAELDDGTIEYEDSLAEYKKERKKAEDELADAERKLDDAQADIDEIELPDIYVLDRSQNEGVATYDADSRRMDTIADVFPLMFFLVAALVALTTMTRMVEDERIDLGTYKALGYGTARIASKYLIYAGIAAGTGAVLGVFALSQLLPFIVTTAYSIIYTVPQQDFPLPVSLPVALASSGLGVGVTLLATWAAVVSSLRETPATLMLPRAPAAGKRILLERVGPLWRRFSFSWKVTCRNLFRYKRRLAMTVVGISGCTALLLVGFGLHDSIWDIIDCQYGPLIHYNTTISLDDEATKADVEDVVAYLKKTGDVQGVTRVQHENMQAGSEQKDETLRVQVVIPQDEKQFDTAVTLRDRVTHREVPLNKDSVVITEKISLKYGLSEGDELLLFDQDTIGNAIGDGHRLRVTGIAENYVGNIVYLGKEAWKTIEDKKPVYATIYATLAEDTDEARDKLASDLWQRDDIATVSFASKTIDMYRNMLSVVDMVVVVLIVSAGALAFIVLYNLTNINIGERVREIASLKVLGFTPREVYAYIFREIILLSLMGDAFGMALGTLLEGFVSQTAEVDYVMFGRTIHPLSYVYAFALTMGFCVLILLFMRRRLDKVNMVESLKSVD